MAKYTEKGIRLSSTCPAFLNSNSTSHTWPFSAVAELIDNAADPGVFAKQIWINVHVEDSQLCMTFTDNGSGLTPNKLHKMLSFGFTDKGGGRQSVQAVGVYGNGFKSGSMRLGRDALIFTKNGGCESVGMLSQSYLENIKAQCVIVPIVPFNQKTNSLVVTEDSENSLAAILEHSIVSSREQIQAHFDSIPSNKGTKILIWNLRRAKDGNPEIDFETDPTDFRLPEIKVKHLNKSCDEVNAAQNVLSMHYSLKEYLSILYLRPRIHIILRGKKIPAKLVSEQLTHVEFDVYKPHFSKDKVKVTFGINKKNKEDYGVMMYNKNRLIKAYEKVGCQLKTSGQRAGLGVIGIIECDFLKPAHNKQDFEYTKEYRLTLGALGMKLNDYWKEVMERKSRTREFQAVAKEQENTTSKTNAEQGSSVWLQCEECLKWRSVPVGHYSVIPQNWKCSQNPNPRYRSCSSQEETNDTEDLSTASYPKNHHKREHSKHRRRENSTKLVDSGCKRLAHSFSDPVVSSTRSRELEPLDTSEPQSLTDEENMDVMTEPGPGAYAHATHLHSAQTTQNQNLLKETHGEQEEPSHKHAMRFESIKRKSNEAFPHVEKKPRLYEELDSSKDTDREKSGVSDKTTEDGGSLGRKHGVNQPRVTREERRGASVNRLEKLESESHRRRLGLEMIKKTQGTNTESTVPTREIACQAESTEKSVSCSSRTPLPTLHKEMIQNSQAMCGLQDPEKRKEKNENPKSAGNEAHDSMLVLDKLHGIRHNVVVLLTSLLPQLDLSGIDLETTDVDNILQQIIEVNELKL